MICSLFSVTDCHLCSSFFYKAAWSVLPNLAMLGFSCQCFAKLWKHSNITMLVLHGIECLLSDVVQPKSMTMYLVNGHASSGFLNLTSSFPIAIFTSKNSQFLLLCQ